MKDICWDDEKMKTKIGRMYGFGFIQIMHNININKILEIQQNGQNVHCGENFQ